MQHSAQLQRNPRLDCIFYYVGITNRFAPHENAFNRTEWGENLLNKLRRSLEFIWMSDYESIDGFECNDDVICAFIHRHNVWALCFKLRGEESSTHKKVPCRWRQRVKVLHFNNPFEWMNEWSSGYLHGEWMTFWSMLQTSDEHITSFNEMSPYTLSPLKKGFQKSLFLVPGPFKCSSSIFGTTAARASALSQIRTLADLIPIDSKAKSVKGDSEASWSNERKIKMISCRSWNPTEGRSKSARKRNILWPMP